MSTREVRVGDWVRMYDPGIWRVYRILYGFNESRFTLSEPKRHSSATIVFGNRLINDSWKRSFSTACCDSSYVSLISREEQLKIRKLLECDERLRKAFEKRQQSPKPVDLVVNLRFGPSPGFDRERFKVEVSQALEKRIEAGMILDEILECVEALGYDKNMEKNPSVVRLQLVCIDHELRGRDELMRRFRFLDF